MNIIPSNPPSTYPLEKYSYSSASSSPSSSDIEWVHFPQRDNLYCVVDTTPQLKGHPFVPSTQLAITVKIVWSVQILEDVNVTDLLLNRSQEAILVLGRPPCLAVKYIKPGEQGLRRFQIRFKSTNDYESVKTLLERWGCPVKIRPSGPQETSTQLRMHPHHGVGGILTQAQVSHTPGKSVYALDALRSDGSGMRFESLPNDDRRLTNVHPEFNGYLRPKMNYFGGLHHQQQQQQQMHVPLAYHSHSIPSFQFPSVPSASFPSGLESMHSSFPGTGSDFLRPNTGSDFLLPTPGSDLPSADSMTTLKPPTSTPHESASNFPLSILDEEELPPPRRPITFQTSNRDEAPVKADSVQPAERPETEHKPLEKLPKLKKPTPVVKGSLPTPKASPIKKKPAKPKAEKGPSTPLTPTPPKSVVPKVKTVAAAVGPVEREIAEKLARERKERGEVTPPAKRVKTEEPTETEEERKARQQKEIEAMIVEALDDPEFLQLCETVGGVWQRIGFAGIGQGLFGKGLKGDS